MVPKLILEAILEYILGDEMKIFLYCALLLWAGTVAAEEENQNFVGIFSLSYMQDSNDSSFSDMGVGIQMYDTAEFSFYAGKETISDTKGDIETGLYGFGVGSLNGEQADIAINFDYWGKQEELTVATWSLPISFYLMDWTVGITPEFRDIALWTNSFSGTRRKFGRTSKGIQARITHHRWYPFEWWIEYANYSYNSNISGLNTRLAGLIFSNTSLQLSSSFIDYRTALAMRYYFDLFQLELKYGQSVSAVDQSRTDNYELKGRIRFSDMVSMTLTVGQTQPEIGRQGEYGRVSFELRN